MPKSDDDLFARLRRAGIRKPVAKALSELSDNAGKKTIGAGHRAVAELRAIADELEKRLPVSKTPSEGGEHPQPVAAASGRATPLTAKKKTPPTPASGPAKKAARPAAKRSSPAPRGENKAKILAALKSGPLTASEIGQKTGIASTTVSAALTRLAKAGEVKKATRGYTLPS